ncbi:MAG: thioredoxin domain-containing protein [Gemmatimonadota bacterium]
MAETGCGSPNRLAAEKSPYLLQHATNPVDWYPWGEKAFERARAEDRPIFLSIGYSTCHWCHVMERESFEDPGVAALLNDSFVSIKVDREERPDIDGVYMTVCQMMTGSGGWPLTLVLTPDKKPFFAGTYFPRESRHGRIGMLDLLPRLRLAWQERRGEILGSADSVVATLRRPVGEPGRELGERVLENAFRGLAANYDDRQGGFGRAPKFPTPHAFLFLLRYWRRFGDERALEMVEGSLRAMRRGGIFDQVGFGFHRYSTDARWLVPHFEKMLYDQALLTLAYVEAYQATGREEHSRVARETLTYVLREMRDPSGGFHSAEDADSEGREGRFYLWTEEELGAALGEEAELAREVYGVRSEGNFAEEVTGSFTGENILHLPRPLGSVAAELGLSEADLEARLERVRRRLFEARERRARPPRDDKILTDWNGLMVASLARAARVLEEEAYLEAARTAAGFLLETLRDAEGRLLHRFRDGEAAVRATANDYAYLLWGLVELYEASYEVRWLRAATDLADGLVAHHWDEVGGGFFLTANDAEVLPVRQKEIYDGALPSSNSVAYLGLLRLARLTGATELESYAARLEEAFATAVGRAPAAETLFLTALDLRLGPTQEVVVVGDRGAEETRRLLEPLRSGFFPRAVVLFKPAGEPHAELEEVAPFTRQLTAAAGQAAAYVCREFACQAPVGQREELLAALAGR